MPSGISGPLFLTCFAIRSKFRPPALAFWTFLPVFPWICPFFSGLRLILDFFSDMLCYKIQFSPSFSYFLDLLTKNFLKHVQFPAAGLKTVCKFTYIINDGIKTPLVTVPKVELSVEAATISLSFPFRAVPTFDSVISQIYIFYPQSNP